MNGPLILARCAHEQTFIHALHADLAKQNIHVLACHCSRVRMIPGDMSMLWPHSLQAASVQECPEHEGPGLRATSEMVVADVHALLLHQQPWGKTTVSSNHPACCTYVYTLHMNPSG